MFYFRSVQLKFQTTTPSLSHTPLLPDNPQALTTDAVPYVRRPSAIPSNSVYLKWKEQRQGESFVVVVVVFSSATGTDAAKLLSFKRLSHPSTLIDTSVGTHSGRQVPRPRALFTTLLLDFGVQLKNPRICLQLLRFFRTHKSLLEHSSRDYRKKKKKKAFKGHTPF